MTGTARGAGDKAVDETDKHLYLPGAYSQVWGEGHTTTWPGVCQVMMRATGKRSRSAGDGVVADSECSGEVSLRRGHLSET